MLASLLAAAVLALASTRLSTHGATEPGCVEAEALLERVEQLTGGVAEPKVRLVLSTERHHDEWRIELELELDPLIGSGGAHAAMAEPEGDERAASTGPLRRTLHGRDCATLTQAAALVIAVHLDAVATAGVSVRAASVEEPAVLPSATMREPKPPTAEPGLERGALGPAREEPTASSPRPRRAGDADAAAASPSPRRRGPRARASAAIAGELGVLPRGAVALTLAGGVGWPHARLELGALASLGPAAVSEQLAGIGGRFGLYTGLVRGCGVPARERVASPLCGGLELGDLRAVGTGLRRPATVDALWVAAVASAQPQWSPRLRAAADPRRARLALGALLDLVVPLRRHRFATAEAGLVHAVDPVAVRLGLRVELQLP